MKIFCLIFILFFANFMMVVELIMTRHSIRVTTTSVEALKSKIQRLTLLNDSLSLENAHLSSPYRIDIIARQELDMSKPSNKLIGRQKLDKFSN